MCSERTPLIYVSRTSQRNIIAIEEQEANGHHLARIVGDTDLEQLLYGDGSKFF